MHKHAQRQKRRACTLMREHSVLLQRLHLHTRAQIVSLWVNGAFSKDQASVWALFFFSGTTNESGAQPWRPVWIDKIRISFFFFFRCEASCSDGPLCTNTFQFNLSPCHGAVTAKCGEVTEIGGEQKEKWILLWTSRGGNGCGVRGGAGGGYWWRK